MNLPEAAADGIVHARKITKADGAIDWTRSATEIWNQVRGLTPWPGAYTHTRIDWQDRLLKIWKAFPDDRSGEAGCVLRSDKQALLVACGTGSLKILELQTEGKRRMTAQEFLTGHALTTGQKLA